MYVLSAFQHDGAHAQFYEAQCCEQSARTCAHHYGGGSVGDVGVDVSLVLIVGRRFAYIRAHAHIYIYGVLACIDAATEYAYVVGRVSCVLLASRLDA